MPQPARTTVAPSPRTSQARPVRGPKLFVSPRLLTSMYGIGVEKIDGVEVFVGVAVQPLVAQAEIQREVRPQFPIVLHEADVVLRRVLRRHRRKARRERGRALQRG